MVFHPKYIRIIISYFIICLLEFLDSHIMRTLFLLFTLNLLNLILIEYLFLIPQYFQCLFMLSIIFHGSIFTGTTMMQLLDWVADSGRHVVELLEGLIICSPLDCLWFRIDGQVDHSIGSLAQLLHLLIPVVQ
jgi:hypothetical protein